MDDSKNHKKTKPKTEEAPALKDSVFSLERLRQDCFSVFGVTTSTFDGATCGLSLQSEHTLESVRELIEVWQRTPLPTHCAKKEEN